MGPLLRGRKADIASDMFAYIVIRRVSTWLRTVIVTLTVATATIACAQQGAAPVAAGAQQTGDVYRLGAADKVRVIVYGEEALSGEFIVSDSGTLSLPLIGEVQAKSRTPTQVISDIQAKLSDGYLKDPRVSMDVLTYRPFYILGEVTKPGEYPYSAGLTVMNAVAQASGFTYRANKRKVFLKRAGETLEKDVRLSPDLQVYPGDTVRIGERYF